jgi:conjugal transfer pilus assembly protein TraW
MGKVEKDKIELINPSVVLKEDVIDDKGNVLYRKGFVINPLDYMDFDETWVFVDGDDEKEMLLADQMLQNHKIGKKVKVILVNGEPGFKEEKDMFYYFDQNGVYSQKFKITATPAIVRQTGRQMEVKYVKLPN